MNKPKNKLWKSTLTVLFFAVLFAGCKDENEGVVGLCPLIVSTNPVAGATNVPLNQVISATFNEAMNATTITQSTLSLNQGAPAGRVSAAVAGTISYDATTFTVSFDPEADLEADMDYTATIAPTAKDQYGNLLQAPFIWSFNTGLAPTVLSTDPANLATNILLNKVITATFSEPMDPLTIDGSSFTIKDGATSVTGAVTYSGTTATFTPSPALLPGKGYTGTITTGAKSVLGTAIDANFVWTFNTGGLPTVTTTLPDDLATDITLNQVIEANFSEAMDPLSITTTSFTVLEGINVVNGVVSYAGTKASFTPGVSLLPSKTYTATITTGAKSQLGFALANDYQWTFMTGISPTVTTTLPDDLATNVPLNQVIDVNFSEAMDPLTLTNSSFTITEGVNVVGGIISYNGNTATFTPSTNLLSGNTYTGTITTLAKSQVGFALENDYTWTFNTIAPLGPPVVNLNSLSEYGIIAGVGVSNNAGPSEIHDMNVGIYPGARSSITGFFDVDGGPGLIFNGAFYAADDLVPAGINAALNQAQTELVQAYDDARLATVPAPSVAPADLGGQTLAPGIWTSASTMLLQNGDLTLDAQGDENAVWIFQIGSGFTSIGGAGGNVILAGGAKSRNVFWVVESSAIIGDNTSFKGNVLAFSSITMNSGAVAEGRMLARNGSVVMTNNNRITRPPN